MTALELTKKCPICGRPYKIYSMTVADQSACYKCVREAEEKMYDYRSPYNKTKGAE